MSDPPPSDLKARMAASYDAIAQTYYKQFVAEDGTKDFRLGNLARVLSLLQEAAAENNELVSPPAQVLELGCGAGVPVTKVLLEHKNPELNVTANDLSPAQIDLARKYLAPYLSGDAKESSTTTAAGSTERLTLIPGDMTALTFPPSTFSAVLGFYSIIHLPRDEQTALMQKIATWLKPGGLFLANFATAEAASVVDEKWLGEEEGWVYWSSWGEEGSVKMVEECGLEVLGREITDDVADARFVWIVARKK